MNTRRVSYGVKKWRNMQTCSFFWQETSDLGPHHQFQLETVSCLGLLAMTFRCFLLLGSKLGVKRRFCVGRPGKELQKQLSQRVLNEDLRAFLELIQRVQVGEPWKSSIESKVQRGSS